MKKQLSEVPDKVQLSRDIALAVSINWLDEVNSHIGLWKDTDTNNTDRNALYFLVNTISDSCKGVRILADLELYDQAGALLRVVIENLWLLDFFGSGHSKANETLAKWVNGKQLKPSEIRKMLAEDFYENDTENAQHLKFMSDVYSELCSYIHPQPMSISTSTFERCLLVVLTSVFGVLPNFLSEFEIETPYLLSCSGNEFLAAIPLLLTNHLPKPLREISEEFAGMLDSTQPNKLTR